MQTPSDNSAPRATSFTKAFIPGLVVGLIVGGFAGAFLPPLLDGSKNVPTPKTKTPAKVTPRDEQRTGEPNGDADKPKPEDEKKPDEKKPDAPADQPKPADKPNG